MSQITSTTFRTKTDVKSLDPDQEDPGQPQIHSR